MNIYIGTPFLSFELLFKAHYHLTAPPYSFLPRSNGDNRNRNYSRIRLSYSILVGNMFRKYFVNRGTATKNKTPHQSSQANNIHMVELPVGWPRLTFYLFPLKKHLSSKYNNIYDNGFTSINIQRPSTRSGKKKLKKINKQSGAL